MPKVSDAHMQTRKEQILKAAYNCFLKKGFQRTTIKDICQESALSVGAVYLHFRDKNDIIESLSKTYRQQRQALMDDVKENIIEAIYNGLKQVLESSKNTEVERQIRLDLRIWAESLDTPYLQKVINRSYTNLLDSLTTIIKRGQKNAEIEKQLDPKSIAQVILSLVTGFGIQKIFDPEIDVDKYIKTIKNFVYSLNVTK